MAWNYNPKDAAECLNEGSYDAELTSVEQKTSKKGSPMLEVIWTVPFGGKDWKIRDYIVNPSTLFKLKNIAKAWHLHNEFAEGRFDLAEHVNRLIVLKLTVENSAAYGDQNQIAGYGESSGQMPPREMAPPPPTNKDADIPF